MAPQPVRPSEVGDFIRCPRLWYYKHVEGWAPPPSAWEPWQLMGTAIHAGLAAHWHGNSNIGGALTAAFAAGWPVDAPPEFSREGLEVQASKVLDAVLKWIPKNMPDAVPVMVEQPLGEDGHTTPDLVTREPQGLVVTDWKTHWNLDADKVRYRLEGIDRTHQFLHYAWAVGEHLKEPVAAVRKVVIVGSPRVIVRDALVIIQPAMIEQWLAGARQMWQDMAAMRTGHMTAYQREDGCMKYGSRYPCPMFEACWTCQGDRERMRQFLVQIAPREGA